MKNRKLILKIAVLFVLASFMLVGQLKNSQIIYAENENDATTYDFYKTTEDDLIIEDGVLSGFSNDYLENGYSHVTLVIPESVTEIVTEAFMGHYEIVTVELPEVLPTIGSRAFENCNGIVEVYDPYGNISIDPGTTSLEYGSLLYYALSLRKNNAASNITIEDGQVFCVGNRGLAMNRHYFVGYLGTEENLVLKEQEYSYDIYPYALWENSYIKYVNADQSNAKIVGDYSFYSCENLVAVILPNTVEEIGHSAFQRSTSLTRVERNDSQSLPEALKTIADFAFAETNYNNTLYIPAGVEEIGESAFYGCNIDSLIFEETSSNLNEVPLVIRRDAFRNCMKLSVVDLPKRLNQMYLRAFLGTGISTVYIHSQIEFGAVEIFGESNVYFPNTATIIFDSREDYLKSVDAPHINVHSSQMTFLVNINFDFGNGMVYSTQGLYGKTFDFVKGANGIWSQVSEELRKALIPTQEGYTYSLWYFDSNFSDVNPISTQSDISINEGIDLISNKLLNARRDALDKIDIYARYIAKPSLTAKNLTYDEGTVYNTIEHFISLLNPMPNGMNFDKVSMNIRLADEAIAIADAGDYSFIISLKEAYGAWAEDIIVPVHVERKALYLNDAISWAVNINGNYSSLLDGQVYIYKNTANEYMYSFSVLEEKQIPVGFKFYSVISVTNSIVRSRSTEVEIVLNSNEHFSIYYSGVNFTFEGNDEKIGENSGLDSNLYMAKAIIKANSNYLFKSLGDVETITNSSRGLTIDISEDRTEARIAKVWYILDVSNNLYIKDSLNEEYTIIGWKYNTEAIIDIPVMEHSTPDDYLTFTLMRNNEVIIEEADIESQLLYYVNDSMPSGNYILTIHIPNVEIDGVNYFGYNAVYSFTVELADFLDDWKEDLLVKFQDVEWQYFEIDEEGIVQVYHHSDFNKNTEDNHTIDLKIWSDFIGDNAAKLNPDRKGYWADSDRDGYYSSRFILTYNLDRMQQNKYYTYTDLEGTSSAFSPKRVDDYIVYYQLTANNYQPLVDENNDMLRREWNFNVTIYDVLTIPSLSQDIVYNNTSIQPILPTNSHFVVEYNDDEYISAGIHTITLISNDSIHYRWNADSTDDTYNLEFVIKESTNSWIQNPNILSWEFDGFDPENNLIIAEAKYGSQVVFSIAKDNEGLDLVSGLERFTTENGIVVQETIVNLLKKLPAGFTYYLISTVETEYVEKLSSSTRFQVFKTQNTWEITPNVMQWKFGSYDKNINLVLAQARINDDNNPAIFTVSYDKEGKNIVPGLEGFTAIHGVVSDDIANILSSLSVNTYYLTTKVSETDSYAALNPEAYEFKISIASNYWEVMPSISTWVEGKYDEATNAILAESHFGEEVRIIVTLAGHDDIIVYDSANGINDLGKAKVGVYELTAYVGETSDYSELSYSFTFQIFEKPGMPWWGIMLIVLGALGVVALVLFILHQSGVLQLLSGKIIIAMRTKATIDATIAAVRANKVAEEAKRSVALAKKKELAEARKKALADFKNRPLEERAAVFDERAKANAQRAEKFQKKADSMQLRAEKMLEKANKKGNFKSEESEQKE